MKIVLNVVLVLIVLATLGMTVIQIQATRGLQRWGWREFSTSQRVVFVVGLLASLALLVSAFLFQPLGQITVLPR